MPYKQWGLTYLFLATLAIIATQATYGYEAVQLLLIFGGVCNIAVMVRNGGQMPVFGMPLACFKATDGRHRMSGHWWVLSDLCIWLKGTRGMAPSLGDLFLIAAIVAQTWLVISGVGR